MRVWTPAELDEIFGGERRPPPRAMQQPVRTHVPGVVWDLQGGVRLEVLPDLRDVAIEYAERCRYPAITLPESQEQVQSGDASWRQFATRATVGAIAEALFALDDLRVEVTS